LLARPSFSSLFSPSSCLLRQLLGTQKGLLSQPLEVRVLEATRATAVVVEREPLTHHGRTDEWFRVCSLNDSLLGEKDAVLVLYAAYYPFYIEINVL
jgi:hypothetical protein